MTTFAAAFAAYLERIPSGHVEAGLRTGDRYQPFPEEMNRVLTTRLASIHFAPTAQARDGAPEGGGPGRPMCTSPATRSSTRCCRPCGRTTASGRPQLGGARSRAAAGAGHHPPAGELRGAAAIHLRRHPRAGRPVPRSAVRASGASQSRGQGDGRAAPLRPARDVSDRAGGLRRVRAPDEPRLSGAHRQRRGAGGGALAGQAGAGAPRGDRAARRESRPEPRSWSAPTGSGSSASPASC